VRKLLTPTLTLSLCLSSFTVCLIFSALALGLIPNEQSMGVRSRIDVANLLALQVSALERRNDVAGIQDALSAVVDKKLDVKWAALRRSHSQIDVEAGHRDAAQKVGGPTGSNSADFVSIPLAIDSRPDGNLEIQFRPIDQTPRTFGVNPSIGVLIAFMTTAGFLGYYLLLRRTLRELDPNRTIPERVKAAFDTLAEGVLIIDERGFILLANTAFTEKIYPSEHSLLGSEIGKFPWAITAGEGSCAADYPWDIAIRHKTLVTGCPMTLREPSGRMRRLIVNATRIEDARGELRGVIATFDDVTTLHNANIELAASVAQLRSMQLTIEEKNEQLLRLASTDPLTSCLNRRSFFARLDEQIGSRSGTDAAISFFMVDADRFKSINDRFGHATGDIVLVGIVEVMMRVLGHDHLVGRYGGEEFCVAVLGPEAEAAALADDIRCAVSEVTDWLPNAERVTVSIGMASSAIHSCHIPTLVKCADEALYDAKRNGRNRVVVWKDHAEVPRLVERSA